MQRNLYCQLLLCVALCCAARAFAADIWVDAQIETKGDGTRASVVAQAKGFGL